MSVRDTIAAIATPPGRGGVGIVRLSGPRTRDIGAALLGRLPPPRHAALGSFRDAAGHSIDRGLSLFFPAPHSFTGEDVLELHGHGGPVVLDLLLARTLELGARLARPGEFSERAFLNRKLDLVQAEAIADLIEAGSATAARSALRSLSGEFSQRVRELVDRLVTLRMYVEAAIDFPEEEVDFLADPRIEETVNGLGLALRELIAAAHQGRLLHDGMTVVLAGRPNAGKSSLLNALAREDAAIVSAIPGTTRDVLRERINLGGLPLHVIDTAGLREARDEIESEGIRRAKAAMEQADRVLLILDDTAQTGSGAADMAALLAHVPERLPRTIVRNKIDLSGRAPGMRDTHLGPEIALSAKTGSGLEQLRDHLKACVGFQPVGADTFTARRRHLDALRRAQESLARARQVAVGAGELLAEELRLAQRALSEITGEFAPDDLLERIFASFCIGK